VLAARLNKALDDACVDLEEVIAGHPGLARHASGDDHDISAAQRLRQLLLPGIASHSCPRVDVAHVGSHAGRASDIVQGELADIGGELHGRKKG
jgi:hypothetical protein